MSIVERLAKQRAVRDWLRRQRDQTERIIRDLELQATEARRRRREAAHRESRWVLSRSRAAPGHPGAAPRHPELHRPRAAPGHPELHRGGRSLAAKHGAGVLLDRADVVAAAEPHADLGAAADHEAHAIEFACDP
ncbi:hypothetical protein [Streptomyces sp. Qhu_M48]|uniref:hypothetical protein n=1 Tax=Streptomyces sp. Qhu_M48 TaxID=3435889 RepID=UPI003F4FBF59